MKKILLACMVTFALSGCLWQTINSHEIERAKQFCFEQGSVVQEMSETFDGLTEVICANRKSDYV